MVIKKYFWLINMALIGLLAWAAANLAVTIASNELRKRPRGTIVAAEPSTGAVSRTPDLDYFDVIARNNIFNPAASPGASKPLSTSVEPAEETTTQEADIPRTELKLTLSGTVVAQYPLYSFAVIRDDQQAGKQKLLQIGNTIQGAEIKSILWRKVILSRNGREEILVMKEPEGGKSSPTSRRVEESTESIAVRKVDDENYVVDRDEFEKMISNVNQFMTQLRVRPYFINGNPAGYMVSDIRKGSVIDELGIQNGDILKSVNGAPITRPEQAFAAYQQLNQEAELTLEIQRNLQTHVLNYQIR
ncbi:MAG: hypothetical protein HY788_12275 [Deltaproteobacteria bacterium]|nr:hypothetical protein [Deltaproteobacteria bacterium]